MITTGSFSNDATPAPNEDIERNSITKEDLEGGEDKKSIKNSSQNINVNGGTYQVIDL